MTRPAVTLALAFVIIGAIGYGLWSFKASSGAVKATAVITGPAVEAVYATATVEPVTWSALSPIRTGRVIEVLADEGASVTAGQILARLDDADLKASLDEQRALATRQKAELARTETLLKQGNVSQERHDQRTTDLIQTESRIRVLEEQIRQLSLSAPTDGIILRRDIDPGEVAQAGTPVLWVGQQQPLRLSAEVDEEDIPAIAPGQTVLITSDAFPDKVMTGSVATITPKGDPISKSYRVYITLPQDTPLLIGMTVETNTIIRKEPKALLIPVDALVDGPAVWRVAEDGRVDKHPVRTGVHGDTFIQIENDLKSGDLVLISPPATLAPGDKPAIERIDSGAVRDGEITGLPPELAKALQ